PTLPHDAPAEGVRRLHLPGRVDVGLSDMSSLMLKRASASRLFGEWIDNDFDVLADGIPVGRIMRAMAAPVGPPWMWMSLLSPMHGYEATLERALAAFAKSWLRES